MFFNRISTEHVFKLLKLGITLFINFNFLALLLTALSIFVCHLSIIRCWYLETLALILFIFFYCIPWYIINHILLYGLFLSLLHSSHERSTAQCWSTDLYPLTLTFEFLINQERIRRLRNLILNVIRMILCIHRSR